MEESSRKPPKIGVSQIKKIVSKVIVITPKQIAEMGLQNQLKNVKLGTIIGQIPEAKSGDGTSTSKKPIKAALLSNLRTKMSTLLNHSPFVMQVDPKDTVDLVYESVDDEACEAEKYRKAIESDNDINVEKPEIKEEKKIEVLSDQVVHYSSDDLDLMLESAQKNPTKNLIIQKSVILNNNKILQKKIVSKSSSDSENLLYVPDLPEAAAASQITLISSSESDREFTPEKDETNDVSVNKNLIDLDTLIAAKKVITDAASRTVPESVTPSAFKDRQILRTYSRVQSFSVVRGPIHKESINKHIIRIHKRGSKRKSDDEDEEWVSPKRPYIKQKKSKDTVSTEQELQTSVEEKVRRIMDECKEKETVEQVVAPKKRGRPRKTPLQPKVDVEPPTNDGAKEKNNTATEKPETVTPRKRGRPRKISVDPAKDDKTSDDSTPKKKQRRRRSDADEREFSAPSSTPGGVRTSGRKRKVVDYAALSGGRISSSEEEDFAEIERLTGTSIKHESSDEESSEEEEVPREDEEKEKSSSKLEAVHPLKKRLKMEHAQAAEKEKADEDEKKDGKDSGSHKHENNDVQNNTTVKDTSKDTKGPSKSDEKDKENSSIKQQNTQNQEKSKKTGDQVKEVSQENETSIHKNDSTNDNNDVSTENSEADKNSTSDEKDLEETESKENDKTVKDQPVEKDDKNDNKVNKNDKGEKDANDDDIDDNDEKDEDKMETDLKNEEESDDESSNAITCGVCKETLDSESGWVKHKQGRHNNLAWKVGEPPLEVPQREPEQM